jgi:hypothetical protein
MENTTMTLTAEDQATAKRWAELLIADIDNHMTNGTPRRYPDPNEQLAKGGRLLDLPMSNGKTLKECTRKELAIIAEANAIAAEAYKRRDEACRLRLV